MRRVLAAALAAAPAYAQTKILATHIPQDPTGYPLRSGGLCVPKHPEWVPSGFQSGGNTQFSKGDMHRHGSGQEDFVRCRWGWAR
jgi:hypothetical protein